MPYEVQFEEDPFPVWNAEKKEDRGKANARACHGKKGLYGQPFFGVLPLTDIFIPVPFPIRTVVEAPRRHQ